MPEQDLLAALQRRMEAFEADHAQAVIEAGALGELVELMLQVQATRTGIPFEVMKAAGGLHWCRAKALDAGLTAPSLPSPPR